MPTDEPRTTGFEELLRQQLRQTPLDGSSACLDGEMLAAWSEGMLPRAQARAVEAHAADCARCRTLLAAFARSDAGGPASASPEPIWRRWHLRWLVPIAATVTAIAVWTAVPRPRPVEESSTSQQASAAPAETAEVRQRLAATALSSTPPAATVAPPPPRRAAAAREARNDSPASKAVAPSADVANARQVSAVPTGNEAAMVTPPVPVEAPTLEQAQLPAPAPNPATAPAPAAAPPPPAAASGPPLGAVAGFARPRSVASPVALEVRSPDAEHRWRVSGSRLEYSTTGGRQWSAALRADAIEPTVLAGAAPGPSVCWLVGRDGLVLLSTDGVRFARTPFAEPVDLTAVRADDARRATVTAADGRSFTTTDAGATWVRD